MRGSRKTVNGTYRYRYAPFLYANIRCLGSPFGRAVTLVTERTLRPRDVICLRRCQHFPIGRCRYLPSPSSLRSATSPTGGGKGAGTETVLRPSDFRAARALRGSRKTVNGAYRYRYAPFLVPIYDALALPLGELSPQVTERACARGTSSACEGASIFRLDVAVICPLRPRCARPPLPQGRQGGAGTETVLRPSDFRAARALRGSRKTVNGAYRYRYAPFLVPIYDALALPLGELSPQVTERTLRPRDVICLRRCQHFPIGRCRYLPSPSSLRSATSPTGERQGGAGTETVFTTIRLSGGTRIEG